MQHSQKIAFDFGEVLFRKSKRSKRLRIQVHPSNGVVVSVPEPMTYERAINFVIEKELWIRKSLAKAAKTTHKTSIFDEETRFKTYSHSVIFEAHMRQTLRMNVAGDIVTVYYPHTVDIRHERIQEFARNAILRVLRFEAKNYLPARTRELAQQFKLPVGEVKVRNNKTRWGSCSAKNNINLNIHLMRLPEALIDYVIYHELAHIKEKNHSKKYWDLLERMLPGARKLDKQLNNYHLVYW